MDGYQDPRASNYEVCTKGKVLHVSFQPLSYYVRLNNSRIVVQ